MRESPERPEAVIKKRNAAWAIAWPGGIFASAVVGATAFIMDSGYLLIGAYTVLIVGYPASGLSGAVFNSRIRRRLFEEWQADDFASLVGVMRWTMPLFFAGSVFFLELASIWGNLPELSAVTRLIAVTAVGGLGLWIAMTFAAREAERERGMQRAFRLPMSKAVDCLEIMAREGRGSLGRVIIHPVMRRPVRLDLRTPDGTLRIRRSRSSGITAKVLGAKDWRALAATWEEVVSRTNAPGGHAAVT